MLVAIGVSNTGEEGISRVMDPAPFVTVISFAVPVRVASTGSVVPSPIGIWPLAATPRALIAEVPEPKSIPPFVRVEAPVPPRGTDRVEVDDMVSAEDVKRTVFVPPNVETPVPPFATERSVERVRAPDTSRAVPGFVVPIPTKPEALTVIPELVAANEPAGVILNLSESVL